MIQFPTQPFAASSFSASQDSPASTQKDPGDLQLGVQGVLLKESGRAPSVAIGYIRRVRGGTAPDIDIGSFSQSSLVLVSGDLSSFHYDANFILSEQTNDPVRRAQYGQSISVTHDLFPQSLHDKLEVTGELWHFTQPFVTATRNGAPSPRSNAVGILWALGYALRPNLVLDAGFDHGLTSTSTQWQTFAGFTYLLPQRLWPHITPSPTTHKHVHRR